MRKVACPRCGMPAAFSPENKWRPFCSERCKMIDLGDWASERYRVPVQGEREKGSEQISPSSLPDKDDGE